MADLESRLRRVYAAIGESVTTDTTEFEPKLSRNADGTFVVGMNFRGKLTEEQMSNQLYSAIHNVANLKDHLKHHARAIGVDTKEIERTVEDSHALQVVIDLSNLDKHGAVSRDGGRSKLDPRLVGIDRGLVLGDAEGNKGTFAAKIHPGGVSNVEIRGPAEFVVNADVFNGNGNKVGDVRGLLAEALSCWEALLQRWTDGGAALTDR